MTQDEALDILKLGHTTYLTGPAGSGKTYVLNKYISYLKARNVEIAVTASTGIAATHLAGQTIHSWSGIGVKDSITEFDLEFLEQKRGLWNRYENTKVLIIDEISMLSANQLDMVDTIARHMKRTDEPFGGMQVVFSGDFFQLPPISRKEAVHYAYESKVWSKTPPVVCYLSSQYRQSDPEFYTVLNEIRSRSVSSETREMIERRLAEAPQEGEETTKLFTHNVDVDELNVAELERLEVKEYVFHMQSKGTKRLVENLKNGCLAPEKLRLKPGAVVMFVKNDPRGAYANGTLGTVVEIQNNLPVVLTHDERRVVAEPTNWPYEEGGEVRAEITQVPLRLAWAITVHKSQGMTLDAAEIDLSRTFVAGQGYVALSRVRALDNIFLKGINEKALEVDSGVAEKDRELQKRSEVALSRLQTLPQKKIRAMQTEFVKRSGGDIDPEKIEENIKANRTSGVKPTRTPTIDKTKALLEKKMSLEEIAAERGLTHETIIGHIEKLLERGDDIDIEYMRPRGSKLKKIHGAFAESEDTRLSPVKYLLEKKKIKASYRELALARLFLDKKGDV